MGLADDPFWKKRVEIFKTRQGLIELRRSLSEQFARMEIRKFQASTPCPCEKVQGEERDHNPRPRDQSCREDFALARSWISECRSAVPPTRDTRQQVLRQKNFRKHTAEAAADYLKWIQECIPTIDKNDARVYCPYCDMKNHPRWTTPASPTTHAVRVEFLNHRQPLDLMFNLCILVAHLLNEKHRNRDAPLCAAAKAMHPLPQSTSVSIFGSSFGIRQPTMGCPSVLEERAWPSRQPEPRKHFPILGQYVSNNFSNVSIAEPNIPTPMDSFLQLCYHWTRPTTWQFKSIQ